MKIQQFEKIIRKVVREEIDYALKREMDKLKKDLKKAKKGQTTEKRFYEGCPAWGNLEFNKVANKKHLDKVQK